MEDYKIIFQSDIFPDTIRIREVSSRRLIDATLEKSCENRWQEILNEAKSEGKKVWDSEVYRLESCVVKDNIVNLELSTIPFSKRLSMNFFTDIIGKLGMQYASLGLYTSCFVITSGGKYVFIEKSNAFYATRKYAFVGGILSKTERILSNGNDIFLEVSKEIQEEIGVENNGIHSIILKAGYITENFNVCFLFEVKLNISLNDVLAAWKKTHGMETANVIGIEKKYLQKFSKILPERDLPKFIIMGINE